MSLNHRFNDIFFFVRYNIAITDEGVMNMNLKEAFRYQNALESMILHTEDILDNEECVTLTRRTYLYKKANPGADNETVTVIPDTEYYRQINELIEFAIYLVKQRETLTAAINANKRSLPIDLDGEISMNRYRQRLADVYRGMARIKSKEVTETNGGVGYRFNNEGNQVAYKCDVRRVTTINFDRNIVRDYAGHLSSVADKVSRELDRCLISYEVDFKPQFDVNDSFDEVFERFTDDA